MFNLNIFNLNKNFTKSRNFIIACLTISLLNSNLLNAGWLDSWFGTAKTAATEHPVTTGCVVGVTAAVGARILDRRASDDRASWGTVALLGVTIGVAAWYKLTSDRDKNLTAEVAQRFTLADKQSKELGNGVIELTAKTGAVNTALAAAQTTVVANQAELQAAQAAAAKFLSAISQTDIKITDLQAEFERQNDATKTAILAQLAASGISRSQALQQIKTGDLGNLLAKALATQGALTAQCKSLEEKVRIADTAAQAIERELREFRAAAIARSTTTS